MHEYSDPDEFLQSLDDMTDIHGDNDVLAKIKKFCDRLSEDNKEIPEILKYEHLAFLFCENSRDATEGTNTYFGPRAVFTDDKGQPIDFPCITQVTSSVIEHWKSRAESARHPIIKARFADLVWDLTNPATNQRPEHQFALIAIDTYMLIAAKKLLDSESITQIKLGRAYDLAKSINDHTRMEKVKQAILDFVESIPPEKHKFAWGRIYDQLLGAKNHKLTEADEKYIIDKIESVVKRITDPSDSKSMDAFAAENLSKRLVQYYRRKDLIKEANRITVQLGEAFISTAQVVEPLRASALYREAYNTYLDAGLKEEAYKIEQQMREIGKKSIGELTTITIPQKVGTDEFEKWIEEITEGSFIDTIARIALKFIERKSDAEHELKELEKYAPIMCHVTKSPIDHTGRTIAEIGSNKDDIDGNIAHQLSFNIQHSIPWLHHALNRMFEKHNLNTSDILNYLYRSPAYEQSQSLLLEKGINAYINKDMTAAAHILVPQIECSIRNIANLCGDPILKKNRYGGHNLLTLGDLLRGPKIGNLLGENTICLFSNVTC